MQSKAATVKEYLESLPEDRRAAVSAVRTLILKNLDKKYQETMQYGMIGYSIPHSIYPAGYHCDPRQPLPFAALASQKNYMSLYLMGIYIGGDRDGNATPLGKWFREAWVKSGKKMDIGKACIRFKTVDELALDVIAEAIRRVPADTYIQLYESTLAKMAKPAKRTPAKTATGTNSGKKTTSKSASKKSRPSSKSR